MKIETLILGDFQTNCYILTAQEDSTNCIIIDPGLEAQPLIDHLKQNNLTPQIILLTHGHCDHIAGLTLLRANFPDVLVAISQQDAPMLADSNLNLAVMLGADYTFEPAEKILEPNQTFTAADITLQILPTPGHTTGGISLYSAQDNVVFTGDALFAGSIGRCDFPGGNSQTLIEGIRNQLLTLPPQTIAYPGHGPQTTIQQETKNNPYLT